jgi:hypothetical protein
VICQACWREARKTAKRTGLPVKRIYLDIHIYTDPAERPQERSA